MTEPFDLLSAKVRIETDNGLLFETRNPKCDLIFIATTCTIEPHTTITLAFVRCIDTATGQSREYFGQYNPEDGRSSIKRILASGNKWPNQPDLKFLTER